MSTYNNDGNNRHNRYDLYQRTFKRNIKKGMSVPEKFDVIIVGGGPAGIFTALQLVRANNVSILMVEKGKDLDERRCPVRDTDGSCIECQPCNLVCGLGGAGAFSDGKLVLSSQVGGYLGEYLGDDDIERLIRSVDDLYLQFGASKNLYGADSQSRQIGLRAEQTGLKLIPTPVRHMGTENCYSVLRAMQDYLAPRIELKLGTMAARTIVESGRVRGIETEDGETYYADYVVLAPGREGSDWLSHEAERLKLTMYHNPIDVGVRVELPVEVMQEITDILYEIKLEYFTRSFNDRVRRWSRRQAGCTSCPRLGKRRWPGR